VIADEAGSELDFTDTATAKVRAAINVIARQVLWAAADDEPLGWWENYPEIGEDDWSAVMNEISDLTPPPAPDVVEAAYELLKMRADH